MHKSLFRGEPVSPGIAVGRVYHYRPHTCTIEATCCPPEEAAHQLARFQAALDAALLEIENLAAGFEDAQAEEGKIFLAHRELLSDEELLELVTDGIQAGHRTAEYAVDAAFSEFIDLLSAVEDPCIAARAADLKDVKNRVLRILTGGEEKNLSILPGPVIIVAHDLLPSDTATLDRDHTLGILTEAGSYTAHSAIIARSLGIPAVLGVSEALSRTTDGELLILDGTEGLIIPHPTAAVRAEYEKKLANLTARQAAIDGYLAAEPRTKDGQLISIGLNIGSDGPDAHYRCIDFVGLFRTEFLYMGSDHLPTEEEQFCAYSRVLEHAGDNPVTLRTLDIGGDKQLPYLLLPHEDNPFLGQRALRLCFAHEDLFRTQLRAAYRASAYGNLAIMFPMVGSLDELIRAKETALSVRQALVEEGVAVGNVPLGLMIEIPAMGLIADLAAQCSDFASIGTNDLCQYLCAVDRMNPAVASGYQSLSPAMLRLLSHIIRAYNAAGKPISVCGELAGQPGAALLLVGMGLKKLSMNGSAIAAVKEALSRHTMAELCSAAEAALGCKTQAEVFHIIHGLQSGQYGKELP